MSSISSMASSSCRFEMDPLLDEATEECLDPRREEAREATREWTRECTLAKKKKSELVFSSYTVKQKM